MSTPNASDLPEHVQKQVDAARKEGEQEGEEPLTSPEPDEVETVQLSRRAQKQQEREAEMEATRARAEQAEKVMQELAQARQQDRQRMEQMERALVEIGAGARAIQYGQPGPQQQSPEDVNEKAAKQMKKAQEALAEGKMDEYHSRMEKALTAKLEARILSKIPQPQVQQFQQPQQVFQKPPWVQVVESKFPDVITNQRGFETVADFLRMELRAKGGTADPEKLERAFGRAREELGLAARKGDQRAAQREMLAGGSTQGAARSGAGGKRSGPTVNVKLAKGINFREIAKRAGMSEAQYARAYAEMNPSDVDKDA